MPKPARNAPRLSPSAAALVVAAAWLVALILLPREGTWITDDANKLLQIRAAAASGWSDFALPWLGRDVSPDLRFLPLPTPYAQVVGGRILSQYPPLFAAIEAAPYRALGFGGLYLFPLAGAIAALFGVDRLARAMGLAPTTRAGAILAVGLGTPLWFYAVAVWEHAPAVGALTIATWLALDPATEGRPRRQLLLWACAALAIGLREDSALFVGVLGAVHVFAERRGAARRMAVAGVSLAVLLVPVLALQKAAVGHALGLHVSANMTSSLTALSARPMVVFRNLLSTGAGLAPSIALLGPVALALLVQPRLDGRGGRALATALGGAAVVASALMLVGLATKSPIVQIFRSNSLFPAAPWIALGLVRRTPAPGAPPTEARLRVLVALYTAAYLAITPTTTGVHWGNRFVLVLYPLLGVLAAGAVASWWAEAGPRDPRRWVAVAAIGLSLVAQLASIGIQGKKRGFSERLGDELARWPAAPVVTDVWWAGHELWRAMADRPVFLVQSDVERAELARRLRNAGHGAMVFVGAPGRQGGARGAVVVDDGGLDYFTLALALHPTGAPAPPADGL